MELHPLAQRFASVAEAYERGRPEYAPAVIGATAAELGVGPGNRVLDLAAGTGKLTRALVAYDFEVVAVEPQASLRAVLADKVAAARVRDGVAEQIPLEDGSAAAVMIADAFHWFDRPRALSEIRRVLALGGGLALLNTRLRRVSRTNALGRERIFRKLSNALPGEENPGISASELGVLPFGAEWDASARPGGLHSMPAGPRSVPTRRSSPCDRARSLARTFRTFSTLG